MKIYFPFGAGFGAAGGLLPLPPPEGLPVVLGALAGRVDVFDIMISFKVHVEAIKPYAKGSIFEFI